MATELSTRAVGPLEKLTPEAERRIHETSLEILAEIGIKVDHEDALDLLADAGATVDREDRVVTFPESLIEDAVDDAPESFTLHARNPDQSATIGDGDPAFSPSGSAPNILTYDEGRRTSTLGDYRKLVKLAQMEDLLTTAGYNLCEPNDVDESIKHYRLMEESIKLSDKPLKGEAWGADRARAALDMTGIAVEDRDLSKPYVFATINTVSPRTLDTRMTGGLLEYARDGQPTMISPAVMAGASGPATLAGTFALGNAEVLAGLTVAQLANPGVPVLYGFPTSNIDIRYGSFAIGSPESALSASFAAQMSRFYGIPSRAGGGLTDAKTVDDQAGAESMFQHLIGVLSGVDLMHQSMGILDSYSTTSPEKFVLDAQRLRYVMRFREGFTVSDDTLALDLYEEVDPGGHFLSERHTLDHGDEHIRPDLYYRDSYDNWADAGGKDAFERAHEYVQNQLEDYERPPLDESVEADLESYVAEEIESITADS